VNVLIALAPKKFRDEELFEAAAAFKKAGIGYEIMSVWRGPCTGMLGASATATISFEEADPKKYGALVIVGGVGAQEYLWDDEILRELVKVFRQSKKPVAAICLAPVVLANAGILKGKKATVFNTPASLFGMKGGGAILVDQPVVDDDWIITANGPAAAKSFAETIVRTLAMA